MVITLNPALSTKKVSFTSKEHNTKVRTHHFAPFEVPQNTAHTGKSFLRKARVAFMGLLITLGACTNDSFKDDLENVIVTKDSSKFNTDSITRAYNDSIEAEMLKKNIVKRNNAIWQDSLGLAKDFPPPYEGALIEEIQLYNTQDGLMYEYKYVKGETDTLSRAMLRTYIPGMEARTSGYGIEELTDAGNNKDMIRKWIAADKNYVPIGAGTETRKLSCRNKNIGLIESTLSGQELTKTAYGGEKFLLQDFIPGIGSPDSLIIKNVKYFGEGTTGIKPIYMDAPARVAVKTGKTLVQDSTLFADPIKMAKKTISKTVKQTKKVLR